LVIHDDKEKRHPLILQLTTSQPMTLSSLKQPGR